MEEVIVISDDDLEEGEILDEIEEIPDEVEEIPDEVEEVASIVEIKPKRYKKLPRRYVLHENKDLNSKQSKHRRKSSHHHRKHHKCPRHMEHSKLGSNSSSCRNSSSPRSHRRESTTKSSLSSLKSAFKNYSSPRREPVKKRESLQKQKPVNKLNALPLTPVCIPTPDELKEKESVKILIDISKESSSSEEGDLLNVSKPEPTAPSIKLDESYKLVNNEEDDDEDEEELRRIALASCLKIPVSDSAPVSKECTVRNVSKNQCSSNKTMNQLLNNCDIYLPGNNEVVDMELDSDCPAEDAESDLFVIDKIPLNPNSCNLPDQKLNKSNTEPHSRPKSPSNHEFLLSSSQDLPIDDLEEAALRAQVIASMRSTKQPPKELPPKPFPALAVENTNKALLPPTIKVQGVPNRKVIRSQQPYFKSSVNFLNMTRKRVVNKAKLNYLKSLNHKKTTLLPQRKINAATERLVITLNNDSSSDESDEENDESKGPLQNASIASIEALISDARQKSDVVRTNNSSNVSCLSRAQQEEYNNLKKILAEREEKLAQKTAVDAERKRALQLKIFTKEVSSAQSNLEKEIDMLTSCEKELLEKKQEYMTSKLKAQLLKEQLHAAEVVRAANLEAWKKTAAKLDIQKKSVTKHKAILDLLQSKFNTKQLPPENSVLFSNKNINVDS